MDTDSGLNGVLNYTVQYNQPHDPVFGIRNHLINGEYVGEVFSNHVLNRLDPEFFYYNYAGEIVYPVTVIAEDNGRPKLSAACFFLVRTKICIPVVLISVWPSFVSDSPCASKRPIQNARGMTGF